MLEEVSTLERLIHTFHRMHHSCFRYELEKRGLDTANPQILFILRHAGSRVPMTQKGIADQLGIAPPTVAVAVKRMEKAGIVRKEADENDLRKNRVTLTERGKTLTDECLAADRIIFRKVIEGLTPEEIKALEGLYMRMICNMGKLGARHPQSLERKEPV